jgi:hypothetical protein
MPAYPGNGLAQLVAVNRMAYMWQNESVAANASVGSLSMAYRLSRLDGAFYPWGASFEVSFSAAPGAFNIYIMGANTDIGYPAPGYYIQLGNIAVVNSSNVGRWDMPSNQWPTFVAAFMAQLTNSVNVTLSVTR